MHAWSDSTIVLSWLDGQPKRFKTYVGNRIADIVTLVPAECWSHIPTQLNPADCVSHGLMPGELATFNLWWMGPDSLWAEPFVKPHQPTISFTTAPEQKAIVQCHVSAAKKPLFLSGRYSNYHHWLKIVAWCLKYLNSHKAHPTSSVSIDTSAQAHSHSFTPSHLPTLTLFELKSAEHLLFKQSQALYFEHEVKSLRSLMAIPNKSKII